MPTCFLKRVLPFALALVIGLMLVKFLGINGWRTKRIVVPHQSVLVDRSEVLYESRVFTPREVDQKARVHARPEPQYTAEARENGTEGTVMLRAVFSASGQVTNIRVMSGLSDGLTERAIEAARQIKFTPALKDGRAVPQYIQLEYNFSLF